MKLTPHQKRKARAACVSAVIERDGRCQWPVLQENYLCEHPWEYPLFEKVPSCSFELTAHEPKHSRNVGRTNPAEAIASCWRHNGFAEQSDGRALAELIGFIQRGNGEPIRKGIAS